MKRLLSLTLAACVLIASAPLFAQTVGTYNDSTTGVTQRAQGTVITSGPSTGSSDVLWSYAAAAGGITNTTTAVTIAPAAGAGKRNFLCTLVVGADTLGAATELAVRDGASGTVIWRNKLQTAAMVPTEIVIQPCIKGSANTLMEVVTLTATVSGGVYVSASGYIGN